MQIQPDDYSCGVYAILNALWTLDDHKTPEEVSELTETDELGTSEDGMLFALKELGYKAVEYTTSQPDNAWRWILTNSIKHPLILIVDHWDHWVVIAGRIKNKVILIDSDPKKQVEVLGKPDLLNLWGYRGYYGIKISRNKS